MEDTLRVPACLKSNTSSQKVLILVLMEDTLRDLFIYVRMAYKVLILVLMEDTLRDTSSQKAHVTQMS